MKFKHLLASASIIALAGCASVPAPPADTRVTIAENLGDSLYVADVRLATPPGGFPVFQANVVNNRHSELWIEYKVLWLDEGGIAIDTLASTWQKTAVAPNDIKPLKAVATSRDAADMRFYVRKMQ